MKDHVIFYPCQIRTEISGYNGYRLAQLEKIKIGTSPGLLSNIVLQLHD